MERAGKPREETGADLAERRRHALELRKAGLDYDGIARRLGYANRGGAYKAVRAALLATYRGPADELRTLELDRLDRMFTAVWPGACAGNLKAIDRALRIMERRARLLGLDAPRRAEVASPPGRPTEVRAACY